MSPVLFIVAGVCVMIPLRGACATPLNSPQDASTAAGSDAGRPFADLLQAVPQRSAPAALQIYVRWTTADPVENPAHTENQFELVSVEQRQVRVRAERSPQVSSSSLVVVAHDASGREIDWRVIADPRVVRSEGGSGPELTGEVLFYTDIDLRLLIPAHAGIARLSIHKVRAEGGVALLDRVGQIDLPRM